MVAYKRFLTREYFLNPYSNETMTFFYDPTDRYESETAIKIRLGDHGKNLRYTTWREDARQHPYRSNVIRTTFVKVFFDD